MPRVSFLDGGVVYRFDDSDGSLVAGKTFVGEFEGIKEAKEYVEGLKISKEIQDLLKEDTSVSKEKIVVALQESDRYRVTESVVDMFYSLVENKVFFPDSVILTARIHEERDIPGKIDFILRDGSKVMLDIKSFEQLNNLKEIRENKDFLLFMTENTETFVSCVNKILGASNGN